MGDAPRPSQLTVPVEYGSPSKLLSWEPVARRLVEAHHYWLATVRPDGRPHVVPTDGLWVDDRWYFGGSTTTVKHRNLLGNPRVSLHLDDATNAVIVEGRCAVVRPSQELAQRLVGASKEKYGYAPPASVYLGGVWQMTPARVLAWSDVSADATRFTFP